MYTSSAVYPTGIKDERGLYRPMGLRCSLISFVILFTVFMGSFVDDDKMLIIEAATLILIWYRTNLRIPDGFIYFIGFLLIHGVMGIICENTTLFLLGRQLVGVIISFMFYYMAILQVDLRRLIHMYLDLSVAVSILCIIEFLGFRLGIEFLYDLKWLGLISNYAMYEYRPFGIFAEPGGCALILTPALYAALYYFFGQNASALRRGKWLNRLSSVLILIGYALTASAAAYATIAVALFFIWSEYNWQEAKKLFLAILGVAGIIFTMKEIPSISLRVNETIGVITRNLSITDANMSTNSWISGIRVAFYSFANTFGFGGGIGSHVITYDKFFTGAREGQNIMRINEYDAYSLFFRLISELGVFMIIPLYELLKFYRKTRLNLEYKVCGTACMCYMAARLLRHGHYFNEGLWFIIVVLFILFKYERNNRRAERLNLLREKNG